jgi:DNA-binding Lrp family transcriptional regulator
MAWREVTLVLDELSKKIVQEMARGISSYEELAKKFGVTRSTVYRRVLKLEEEKVIIRQIRIALDFEKIGRVAIHFGLNVEPKDEEKAVEILSKLSDVKMIWRTYGTCNLVMIVFCDRGEEGKAIDAMRRELEEMHVTPACTCVGYSWEKNNMTPF